MEITAPAATAVSTSAPKGVVAAGFVLGGSVLSLTGLTWDIQWHSDVGPDTFFTLPHLLLYSGSAIAGIASLVVVLLTTAAERAGRTVDPIVGGRAVGVFGRTFAAPVGYLISGLGAASFLLYGLWDQWWHSLYGFDAVIASPPHIGLLLSVAITMVGTVMVFATARHQRWGLIGGLVSLAVLFGFSTVITIGLGQIPTGPVEPLAAGTAFLAALILILGARLLDRPGGALGVAAVLAALQAVFWWFSPWAARVYADAIGLPVRDYVDGVPDLPSLWPLSLLVVGGLVELLLGVTRRGGNLRRAGWLAGGVAGLVVGGLAPVQTVLLRSLPLPGADVLIATAVAGLVLGAVGGFLAVRFGGMLRQLAPVREG
ncbi:hypothetical protein [Crossiella sp. CA198]|uniref:hypothetical protein n=1 Tax=Crossiella sp. CA198 TaxID=3455607 RepID=UPI003F8D1D8E